MLCSSLSSCCRPIPATPCALAGLLRQLVASKLNVPVFHVQLFLDGVRLGGQSALDEGKSIASLGITASSSVTFAVVTPGAPGAAASGPYAGAAAGGAQRAAGSGGARGPVPFSPSQVQMPSPASVDEAVQRCQHLLLSELPQQMWGFPALLHAVLHRVPRLLTELARANADMAKLARDPSPVPLAEYLHRLRERRQQEESKMAALMTASELDPFNIDLQKQIEEQIRLQNVEANMNEAMEVNPAAFASVTMLYVPMVVNGHPLAAFVDSGAQATIMSENCARRCGILRLIDRRFEGVAKGVGTSKILGKVHAVKIQVSRGRLWR